MRAVIGYKAASESEPAGDVAEIEIRHKLPPLATRTASTGAKQ